MLGAIQNRFLNGTKNAPLDEKKPVPEGVLPASWYTEPVFHDFERRAIFSKHWLITTHRLRLSEPGSYLRFDIAGFDFILVKNKEGKIQAFHNVCRHRAYPILDKNAPSEGKKSIFSCGYHGWSYNLDGKLTKAPKFDEMAEFDANEYSLFKIHTHVDKVGFIWVNFDSAETPAIPWEKLHGGSDEQPRLGDFSLDDYVYHRTWITEGKYNWKVYGENYNECYHCKASHPGINRITNLERYSVTPHAGRLEHFTPNRDDIKPEDFEFFGSGAFTYNFPNSSVNLSTPYFYLTRVLPTSATTVRTEYQVFRNPASPQDAFDRAAEFFEGFEMEDYDLCTGVQQNLDRGVYVQGPLHDKRESGVVYFKNLVNQQLREHWEEEVKAGEEIWPAKRRQQLHAKVGDEEKFARDVCACGMKSRAECA
ncbi:Rieske [2Fe-2S] iron-sulfur domain-containing protein [Aspergillus egyptiacus]|nr:Rieske [2Fe-2S] iron-sulfur domain-containing protein [Aspergillus egyptiacus]